MYRYTRVLEPYQNEKQHARLERKYKGVNASQSERTRTTLVGVATKVLRAPFRQGKVVSSAADITTQKTLLLAYKANIFENLT